MNIQFDESVSYKSSDEENLRQCVVKVSSKIKVDVSQIKWIIYNYEKLEIGKFTRQLHNIKQQINGCRFDIGFYRFGTNEIWISIKKLSQTAFVKGMGDSIYDVIIDEITHFITQKDHGTPEYDSLHRSLLKKFYD